MNKAKILLTLLSTVLPLFVAAQDFLNLRELTDKTTTAELPPNTAEVVFIAATSDLVVTSSHPNTDRFGSPHKNNNGMYEYVVTVNLLDGQHLRHFSIEKKGTGFMARTQRKILFEQGERHFIEVSEPASKFMLNRMDNGIHLKQKEGCVEIVSPMPDLLVYASDELACVVEQTTNSASSYVISIRISIETLEVLRNKYQDQQESLEENTTIWVGFANSNVAQVNVQHLSVGEKIRYAVVPIHTESSAGVSTTFKKCGEYTLTDVDGNTYNTVQIGEQCWMKENLRTTHYADGTSISHGSTTSKNVGYWYYPNDNPNLPSAYGLLYNWTAVMHNASPSNSNPSYVQGICPAGWHVPSDAEWIQFTDYVSSMKKCRCKNKTTSIARSLVDGVGWTNNDKSECNPGYYSTRQKVNRTGFSALPAGTYDDTYQDFGYRVNFWSSTASGNSSYIRRLYYDAAGVSRTTSNMASGCSVRCIRD